MITYQDLLKVENNEKEKADFVRHVIYSHKNSEDYKTAYDANEYYKKRNVTITNYRKLLYTLSGQAVDDNYSANYKLCSGFFPRFIIQQNQFLLGNGVSWNEEGTADALGEDFDIQLQKLGRYALIDKMAFGFWNNDHLEVFRYLEMAPLWDEEDGSLKAAVRFWQIDTTKPLRATLYELDGYTSYTWRNAEEVEIIPKRAYKLKVRSTPADGEEIYDGENYPTFPIVPLWGNQEHQSEIVGIRESIDAYDLIRSGFANDLDDASQIYWIIQNAGGMDDIDLAKFIKRMQTVKAAVVDDDGARAEAHTMDVPYASREALLDRLRRDLYEDFMALDVQNIAGGATTATQIKASYDPLNSKADMYEYCVIEFIQNLLNIIGINDTPTFTRSIMVNTGEEIDNVLKSAQFLSQDYVTEKILMILGDADRLEDVKDALADQSIQQFASGAEMLPEDEEGLEDEEDAI